MRSPTWTRADLAFRATPSERIEYHRQPDAADRAGLSPYIRRKHQRLVVSTQERQLLELAWRSTGQRRKVGQQRQQSPFGRRDFPRPAALWVDYTYLHTRDDSTDCLL
jgi:hypothetical protein